MKKMLLTILLVAGLFAQNGIRLTGGINYSTVAGDYVDDIEDFGADIENVMGFRFGIEKIQPNGWITGATFTQMGFEMSVDGGDGYYYYGNYYGGGDLKSTMKINYLAGYAQKSVFQLSPQMDIVAGARLGYFFGGNMEMCSGGECEDEDIDSDDWDDMDNNMWDYGLVIGSRYHINETTSIIGSYYLGLAEWGDDMEMNNRSFQFSLSYALGGGGDSPDRASRSSSNSNRSSPKSKRSSSANAKSSESDSGECTPPSKAYGNGDVDNFLNNAYKVCQILSETTEQLNEVNDFVENPRMYIVKKANEATGPYREMLSSVREYYSDPDAFIQDAFGELSAEAEKAFKDAKAKLAVEFERKVTEFLVQQLIDALGLAKDGISGSGDALGGLKSLGFADKMTAMKDVKGALKNLKSAVDTIPKLQKELNRASENIGKLLN